MSRPEGRLGRTLIPAIVALGALTGAVRTEGTEAFVPNARLRQTRDRSLLAEAIRGAARRLADPRCQELLGEFQDRRRQPLRAVLDAQSLSAPEFLGSLFFYDGTQSGCRGPRLAYTEPGSHVVYVCATRFSGMYEHNTTLAEVAIVHETLHCLGLGENPPTWQEINDRIQAACRK
jgi:hypothetical protein